jgi:HK97 family phage portal protein
LKLFGYEIRKENTNIQNSWSDEIRKFLSGEDSMVSDDTYATISRDTAMRSTAQFSAVRVLNETIGSIPIQVYRKNEKGREQANNNNLYEIFHEVPNDEMTCQALKESGMMSINLGGNAFFQKLKNNRGDIIGLYPIDYSKVTIERNKATKKLEYKVNTDGISNTLTRNDIFHIPAFSYDGICGLSPIAYCASAILLGNQYQEYNKNFFKNGAFTSGTVEFDGRMSDDAFKRFREDFASNYKGLINAGKPIILEEGGKFKPLKMSQADAQFMESRRFQLEEIARIYRVPLTLLQDFGRATWNNMEQQQLFFVMFTILPIVKRWEENIKTQIMTPKQRQEGLYVEFQLNNLLRGDAKTRAELYASGRNAGYFSINDIRRLENMNTIENGDSYMQPLNFINVNLADEYYSKQISKNEQTKQKDMQNKAIEEIYNLITRREE